MDRIQFTYTNTHITQYDTYTLQMTTWLLWSISKCQLCLVLSLTHISILLKKFKLLQQKKEKIQSKLKYFNEQKCWRIECAFFVGIFLNAYVSLINLLVNLSRKSHSFPIHFTSLIIFFRIFRCKIDQIESILKVSE